MGKEDIAVVGLPSAGLRKLTGELEIRQLEDTGILRAFDKLAEQGEATPAWMVGGLARGLREGPRDLVLVYQTPWGFLERLATRAQRLPEGSAQIVSFASGALEFWHAYHAGLLGLRHSKDKQCLLVNGDRPLDSAAVADAIGARFGSRPARKAPGNGGDHADAAGNEQAFCQVVDALAPRCLELYSALESSADLFGREPEFESADSGGREAQVARVLALAAQRSRIERTFARHGFELRDLEAQLEAVLQERKALAAGKVSELQEKLDSMQNEAALYLHQIHSLEAELKALGEARGNA